MSFRASPDAFGRNDRESAFSLAFVGAGRYPGSPNAACFAFGVVATPGATRRVAGVQRTHGALLAFTIQVDSQR